MFVKIRRQNTNLYLSVDPGTTITLQEDNKSGFDNRWRLTSDKIVSVWRPGFAISTFPHLKGKLALGLLNSADGWYYGGPQFKQLKMKTTNQCIDGNVKAGGEVFMWNCANRVNHQWFFEYTVPPIETHGLPLGRILNDSTVQFIFKERQMFASIIGGNDALVANSVFPDATIAHSTEFKLRQVVTADNPNDSVFLIRAHDGNYLYMSGGVVKSGQLIMNDTSFYFRIVPNGNNLYILQGLRSGEGYARTINNLWSGDNTISRTTDKNDPWAQMYVNVLVQTSYAKFVQQGNANPKWCCGIEYGDDPVATQACTDIGYVPSHAKCDDWMQAYCDKNPKDPACPCLKTDILMPQCFNLRCANNPRAYKNSEMIGGCENMQYVDCRQEIKVGSAESVDFDRVTFNQVCGNKTGGETEPTIPEDWDQSGFSTLQWILIVVGFLILITLISFGISIVAGGNEGQSVQSDIIT